MPAPVRASDTPEIVVSSHGSATCVFENVIMNRLNNGNHLITGMSVRGVCLKAKALAVASRAPVPSGKMEMDIETYFNAQAYAARYPAIKDSFNIGVSSEGGPWEYLGPFVTGPLFRDTSPPVYILSLIYLDRIRTRKPACFLHSFNFRRLILAAFIVAIKFHEDTLHCYDKFAIIGGLSKADVSTIEHAFLKAIGYHVFVSDEEYENAEYKLVNEAANGVYRESVFIRLRNENLPSLNKILRDIEKGNRLLQNPMELSRSFHKGREFRGKRAGSHGQVTNRETGQGETAVLQGSKLGHLQIQYHAYWRAVQDHEGAHRAAEYDSYFF